MLRYEYEDAGKRVVFIQPASVIMIREAPAFEGGKHCYVELGTGASAIVPLSPDSFAAEVEKALEPVEDQLSTDCR